MVDGADGVFKFKGLNIVVIEHLLGLNMAVPLFVFGVQDFWGYFPF